MHVLKKTGRDFDYLVGSQIEGFETMVRFSDAPVMVIEGDEYLTSALDRVPKFLKYKPHFTQITGIAWDHINVFPTFENYVQQFADYIDTIEPDGQLIYFKGDEVLADLCRKAKVQSIAYDTPPYRIEEGRTILTGDKEYTMSVFGEHNLQNMEGARLLCENIGISRAEFYTAIASFTGSARRLEKVFEKGNLTVFRDFAHSPSKLKATVEAVKQQYQDSLVVAVFELHTFSSLNRDFLPQYHNAMAKADKAIVYYSAHVFELKRMPVLDQAEVKSGFGGDIEVFTDSGDLSKKINDFKSNVSDQRCVLLVMSSGNFDNAQLW
jgi:UDP-N-acetylmuramate: L-alanyl-gamma-D-glutamyl-meso-diaminopimelate ligase